MATRGTPTKRQEEQGSKKPGAEDHEGTAQILNIPSGWLKTLDANETNKLAGYDNDLDELGADDYVNIPKEAPFTAYVSNLPKDVEVTDVMLCFYGFKVKSVRLPKSRGCLRFGYVEFETRQDLAEAVAMSTLCDIKNRKIRIEVARRTL